MRALHGRCHQRQASHGCCSGNRTPPDSDASGARCNAEGALLRRAGRVGVHLIHRRDEGLGVLEIRGEPHPGLFERVELIARFRRGGDARELGATARVLAAFSGVAWHGLF